MKKSLMPLAIWLLIAQILLLLMSFYEYFIKDIELAFIISGISFTYSIALILILLKELKNTTI